MSNQSLVADRIHLSDAEIVAELNALTVRKVVLSGRQTVAVFTRAYGLEDTATLLASINIAVSTLKGTGQLADLGMALILEKYGDKYSVGDGLELADQFVQEQLTIGLSQVVSPELLNKLLSLGATYVSPWKDAGNADDATVEEVAEIRAQIALDAVHEETRTWLNNLMSDHVNGPVSTGATKEEVKAIILENW